MMQWLGKVKTLGGPDKKKVLLLSVEEMIRLIPNDKQNLEDLLLSVIPSMIDSLVSCETGELQINGKVKSCVAKTCATKLSCCFKKQTGD